MNTTNFLNYLLLFLVCVSCDSENAWNCLRTAGTIQQVTVNVSSFNKINVLQRSQLIVKQGNEQKVVVESGENLLNDIKIEVKQNTLIIDNTNACNIAREYGITKIYVTTDRLEEIRNASGLPVVSDGVLAFPELTLRSEDLEEEDLFRKVGDFDLQLDCAELSIETNGKSNFFLRGKADTLIINFLEGDNRCECADLSVQNARIFHRGTNDVFISPQESVMGELRSIGNLILSAEPPILNVESFYTGKVIVQE